VSVSKGEMLCRRERELLLFLKTRVYDATSAVGTFFWLFHVSSYARPYKLKTKLRGLSPHANYTDRAAAASR